MPPAPRRLAPHTFLDRIQRTLYVLVRVGTRVDDFHPGVAAYFDDRYPRLFSFGILDRRDVRQPHFWEDAFQTAGGRLRGGVKDGYHLFHGGLVVGFHPGVSRAADLLHDDERMRAVQRAEVFKHAFQGAPVVGPGTLETCRQIVLPLDDIVRRKQAGSGFGGSAGGTHEANRWVHEERSASSSSATTASAAPDDPFVLLEVSPDVTDEDLKTAYRRAMKLNHPDKVAHMSEAIQDFARQRSQKLKAAYDRIRSMRR